MPEVLLEPPDAGFVMPRPLPVQWLADVTVHLMHSDYTNSASSLSLHPSFIISLVHVQHLEAAAPCTSYIIDDADLFILFNKGQRWSDPCVISLLARRNMKSCFILSVVWFVPLRSQWRKRTISVPLFTNRQRAKFLFLSPVNHGIIGLFLGGCGINYMKKKNSNW